MAAEDEDLGFLTRSLSSPSGSIPYAIGMGLLAGMTPGTARVAQGVNQGVQLGLGAERYNENEKRRQRLNQALGKMATSTSPVTSTKIGLDPAKTTWKEADPSAMHLDEMLGDNPLAPPKELPTYQATEEKPNFTPREQQYINALAEAGQSDKALSAMGLRLFKEPQKPVAVRPGGSLVDPQTGQPIYTAPAAPEKTTWTPYQTDLGDKVESGVVNRGTGERRVDQIVPKSAAPAQPKTPEELARIRAQIDLDRARVNQAQAQAARINALAQELRDPSISKERLTTIYSQLLRRNQMLSEQDPRKGTPEYDDLQRNKTLLRNAESRLSKLVDVENSKSNSVISNPGAPGTKATGGQTFDALPPASEYKGRTMNGGTIKSDGKNWIDQNGNIVGGGTAPGTDY